MLDSLEKAITNYKKADTTLVNMRIKYASRKMFLTPADTTWQDYNHKTLSISKQLNYPKGIGITKRVMLFLKMTQNLKNMWLVY